eukprot:scaffold8413_cov135-Isochrysis_galbana.AAC.5
MRSCHRRAIRTHELMLGTRAACITSNACRPMCGSGVPPVGGPVQRLLVLLFKMPKGRAGH